MKQSRFIRYHFDDVTLNDLFGCCYDDRKESYVNIPFFADYNGTINPHLGNRICFAIKNNMEQRSKIPSWVRTKLDAIKSVRIHFPMKD